MNDTKKFALVITSMILAAFAIIFATSSYFSYQLQEEIRSQQQFYSNIENRNLELSNLKCIEYHKVGKLEVCKIAVPKEQ